MAIEVAKPGKGTITSVKDSDPELLKYLQKTGATPGKKVIVVSREAYDGSVEILLDKNNFFISKEVSQNILLSIDMNPTHCLKNPSAKSMPPLTLPTGTGWRKLLAFLGPAYTGECGVYGPRQLAGLPISLAEANLVIR